MKSIRESIFTLGCGLLLLQGTIHAEPNKGVQVPEITLQRIDYGVSGEHTVSQGQAFPIRIKFDFKKGVLTDKQSLFVDFYLAKNDELQQISEANLITQTIFLGSAQIQSLLNGYQEKETYIETSPEASIADGDYFLIAKLDLESNKKALKKISSAKRKRMLSKSVLLAQPLPVTYRNTISGRPQLHIADFKLKSQSVVLDDPELAIEGLVAVESSTDLPSTSLDFCLAANDNSPCNEILVWNSETQRIAEHLEVRDLRSADAKTAFLTLTIPDELLTRLRAETATLNRAEFVTYQLRTSATHSENPEVTTTATTLVRFFPGIRSSLRSAAAQVADSATPLPTPPDTNRFGSKERPWNKPVVVPDIPPRYVPGTIWTEAQYNNCLRFYCQRGSGGHSNATCEQASCGLSREDFRFGSVSNTIVGDGRNRTYSFSNRGFGVDFVLAGDARAYRNPIVGDYVGGSVKGLAALDVELFGATLSFANLRANAAIDTTTLENSIGEVVFRSLGVTVFSEEKNIYPASISKNPSFFIGRRWGKEVKLGIAKGELTAEAGGTLGVTAGLKAGLVGIEFSSGPTARVGASARISGGFGSVASIGIEGGVTLISDALTHTATFAINLNKLARTISPALNMNISNTITGPSGYLDLFGRILGIKWRKTLMSWSTYSRTDGIYNSNRSLGVYPY